VLSDPFTHTHPFTNTQNFPTVSRKESYMDAFDYVMYGLVYKYAHEGGGGGSAGSKEGVRVCVYVSFGGLLMKLKGDAAKLSVLDVDSKVYLCIASV
jgi:DNA-directed RNA polymerase I, II, and III subunit RPABC3